MIPSLLIKCRTVVFLNGVKLEIFFRDHIPPHVHATSAEHEVLIVIEDASIYEGNLPRKQLRIAVEYVQNNRTNLLAIWEKYNPK